VFKDLERVTVDGGEFDAAAVGFLDRLRVVMGVILSKHIVVGIQSA
jgi:hypothetical protein